VSQPAALEDEGAEDLDDAAPATVAAGASQEGRRLSDVAREAALAAERIVIADTLRQVHWNRRKAAQLLGVSYKTLLNKIKETGIERP
jgi:DNA-binding NtrC family response regulator